jgi:galactokinase/mevalonate kinase-like predicted kinase
MLFYCPKERQSNLRLALKDLKEFDFHFDKDGSKIIYYGQD